MSYNNYKRSITCKHCESLYCTPVILIILYENYVCARVCMCVCTCVHMCVRTFVCICVCTLSRVQLFATPWTVACQAPLSMEFSRQECWRRLPFPTPGDLHNAGTEPTSLVSPALAGGIFTTAPPGKSYPNDYN